MVYCDRSVDKKVTDYSQLKSPQLDNNNSSLWRATQSSRDNSHLDYIRSGYCSYRDVTTYSSDVNNRPLLPKVILRHRNEKERKRVRYAKQMKQGNRRHQTPPTFAEYVSSQWIINNYSFSSYHSVSFFVLSGSRWKLYRWIPVKFSEGLLLGACDS